MRIRTRPYLTAWMFGVICGAIPPMYAVTMENFDARKDLIEYREALREARETHRHLYGRLSTMEQRIDRKQCELIENSLIEEQTGNWAKDFLAKAKAKWAEAKAHADKTVGPLD